MTTNSYLDNIEGKALVLIDRLAEMPLTSRADAAADVRDLNDLKNAVLDLAKVVYMLAEVQHKHGRGHE